MFQKIIINRNGMNSIRNVSLSDAQAIADIYNYYIANTTITFETELVTKEEMERRIQEISAKYPYFVYEEDGKVIGYCYAHPWRTRAAFLHTLETSVYLDHQEKHHGVGALLVKHLIELCRAQGYHVLIACITSENTDSCVFHEHLGFKPVAKYDEVGWKFERWVGLKDYELIL